MPRSGNAPPPASAFLSRHCDGLPCALPVARQKALQFAERASSRQANHLPIVWLVLHPIRDHQLCLGLRAGVDHEFAICDRGCHRLFAQHVFAGARRAHGKLPRASNWQGDVHQLDRSQFFEPIEVPVVENVLQGSRRTEQQPRFLCCYHPSPMRAILHSLRRAKRMAEPAVAPVARDLRTATPNRLSGGRACGNSFFSGSLAASSGDRFAELGASWLSRAPGFRSRQPERTASDSAPAVFSKSRRVRPTFLLVAHLGPRAASRSDLLAVACAQ